MCAIGGIIQLDRRKSFSAETKLDVIGLLTEMQKRGGDAWGMYLEKRKGYNTHLNCGVPDDTLPGELFKMEGEFSKFANEKDGVIYLDHTNLVLMHTRASTQGDASDNINNHPFSTKNFILSHNGIISNEEALKKKYNLKTDIECDSYFIVALIQHFFDEGNSVVESIKKATNEISGGFSCWLYHKDEREIYFFRNSRNPFEYYIDEDRGIFVFASMASYIRDTLKTSIDYSDVKSSEFNSIFKLEKNKLLKLDDFENNVATTTYSSYNYNDCNTSLPSPVNSYDVNDFDKLMGKLVRFMKKFDDNATFNSILGIIDDEVNLIVRSEGLVRLLSKTSFSKFYTQKRGEWRLYSLTRQQMETITKNFLEYVSDDTPKVSSEPKSETKTFTGIDSNFVNKVRQFSKDTNLDVKIKLGKVTISKNKHSNKRALKLIKQGGYVFGKHNQFTLGKSRKQKEKLSKIMNEYYVNW